MKRILIILFCICNVVCGYSQNNIQAVDLGLPSGTLWGDMNLGAKSIKDPGDYYMWGETTPKKMKKCNEGNYKYFHKEKAIIGKYTAVSKYNFSDGLKELQKSDDAAYLALGGTWHVPTLKETQELADYCQFVDEVFSVRLVGPNGNSITIPKVESKVGYGHLSKLRFWTSSVGNFRDGSYTYAYSLSINDTYRAICSLPRCEPNFIRPVCAGNKTYKYNQPDVSLKNVINNSQKLSFNIEIASPNVKILKDEIWINKKDIDHDNKWGPYESFMKWRRPMALTDSDNFSIKDTICLDKQKNPDFFKSSGPIRCQIGVETGLGKKWYTFYINGNQVTEKDKMVLDTPTFTFNSPTTSTSRIYDLNISVNSNFAVTLATARHNNTVIVWDYSKEDDVFKLSMPLKLKEGANSIHAEVTNIAGTAVLDTIVTYIKPSSTSASASVQVAQKQETVTPMAHIRKVALVIGNASYAKSPLHNPLNDADDVSAKLKSLGFDVITAKDCKTKWDMENVIDEFCNKAQKADAGLFYYSGHGMQLTKAGGNYLIPTEASMDSEAKVKEYCVSLEYVLQKMEESKINMKIAIFDACRDNPFRTWNRGGKKGLAAIAKPPYGTFIAFATSADDVAADGKDRNSPFTNAFLTALDGEDLEIENVFTEVSGIVKNKTNGDQHPWITNDLSEPFYFGQGK